MLSVSSPTSTYVLARLPPVSSLQYLFCLVHIPNEKPPTFLYIHSHERPLQPAVLLLPQHQVVQKNGAGVHQDSAAQRGPLNILIFMEIKQSRLPPEMP